MSESMSEAYSGSELYNRLFEHMTNEHSLIITESEANDIANVVNQQQAREIERLREWIPASEQEPPMDGTYFEAWHIMHKCAVCVCWLDSVGSLIEATFTTRWPADAFTHWRKASTPPNTGEG